MAGRTGAGAAAIGFDAGNVVVARAFHDGHAIGNLDHMFFAAVLDIGNLGHSRPLRSKSLHVYPADVGCASPFCTDARAGGVRHTVSPRTLPRGAGHGQAMPLAWRAKPPLNRPGDTSNDPLSNRDPRHFAAGRLRAFV